ncbi:hypothetical protein [Pseudobacteroides cellulosolvens]|nr:hypothetical protein [Pseudobacteroides cellulosolvens]
MARGAGARSMRALGVVTFLHREKSSEWSLKRLNFMNLTIQL